MARNDPQMNLRVPVELKEKIERAAFENNRTITAEAVSRLDRSFEEKINNEVFSRYMKAAEENLDALRKQLKVTDEIMKVLAHKLPDDDPLKKSVLHLLENS